MISEPLQTERMDDGRRLLLRDLIVGLGYVDPELVPFHDSKSGAAGLGPRNSQYGTIIRVPTGFDTEDISLLPGIEVRHLSPGALLEGFLALNLL